MEERVARLQSSLTEVCSFEQLQRLQAQVNTDHGAASRAQDAARVKGAEAHSCQELLQADSGLLDDNRGITEGLRAQLRESQEAEASLRRRLEAARGRIADAQVRMDGCKVQEASLMEAGARAARVLRGQRSRQKRLEPAASAVLPELVCLPGAARIGIVASTLDRMSGALAQAAGVLWAGEAENADLL